MRFANPIALLWLLLVPFIIVIGWPSHGYNRKREIFSLSVRLILCLSLILALAGLEIADRNRSTSLAVVFVLDVSDSMSAQALSAAQIYIQQALASLGPNDQSALIVFGKEALVEYRMSTRREFTGIKSIPITNHTDLSQAIYLGLALFPPTSASRMVILSDGAINIGNTSDALQIAKSAGVDIQVLPLKSEAGVEVLIRALDVPPRLRQGDQFDLEVTLESTQAGPAQLQAFIDDNLVYTGNIALKTGLQTISIPLTAQKQGFIAFQIRISAPGDTFYQNNRLSTFSQVSGPAKVLIVAPPSGEPLGVGDSTRPDEYTPLKNALEASGFLVEVVSPVMMPSELTLLANYASVVIVDVPARHFTRKQMTSLQIYVRELGGGLVAVGGPTSFGVGGYFRTPLEETLPVDMEIKDEQRRPSLVMIFIIDRSGSMSETSGGPTKLDLAKEAVIRSVELLNPNDQVGVIAFDDAASWVVPVAELGDGVGTKEKVSSIGIGGGTDIMAGVRAMAAIAPDLNAGVKHVILLTDGGADPTGIPELIKDLNARYGITLSTIGVGKDAAPFLPQLATVGGGRYHFAADPSSIPNIYAEETALATRAYIIEEEFYPAVLEDSSILEGIEGFPKAYGYVGTTAKETAQTILESPKEDPILATWRYGLGKSVAFTSDASGRWAKDWLGWKNFPAFWNQVVRYTMSENLPAALDVRVVNDLEQPVLVVDAASTTDSETISGPYLNHYTMYANILSPSGKSQNLQLDQVAPGRYVANFDPQEEGVFLIRINGNSPDPNQAGIGETAGWSMDYSPEYLTIDADPDRLARLALHSGGRIADSDPAKVFAHNLQSPGIYQPIWHFLLALAVFLLPVDIAIRRLALSRSDLHQAMQKLRALRQKKALKPLQRLERTETLSNLFSAKQKASRKPEGKSIEDPERAMPDRKVYPTGVPSDTQQTLSQKILDSVEQDMKESTSMSKGASGFDESKLADKPVAMESVRALLSKKRAQRQQHEKED